MSLSVPLMAFATALVAALVAAYAFLGADLARIASLAWLEAMKAPSNANLNSKSCVYADRALFGCESAAVVDDTAYIACSHRQSRLRWYPALNFFAQDKKIEQDNMYTFDFKTKLLRRLMLPQLNGTTSDIVLHGVSARRDANNPDVIVVAAINHRKSGTCVEILEHHKGSNNKDQSQTLRLRRSVCDPLLTGASGVALAADGSSFFASVPVSRHDASHDAASGVAATSVTYPSMNPVILLRALFRASTGGKLIHYDAAKHSLSVARDSLSYPTHVALSPDAKRVYIVEGLAARVSVFTVLASGKITGAGGSNSPIQMPHAISRIAVVADDDDDAAAAQGSSSNVIFAAGVLRLSDLWWYLMRSGSRTPAVPVAIMSSRANTRDDSRFYGAVYLHTKHVVDADARVLSASSFVAPHIATHSLLVGGPLAQGLVLCNLKNNDDNAKPAAADSASAPSAPSANADAAHAAAAAEDNQRDSEL